MPWWEIVGWAGSVLVVVSLMVPSVRRFRVLNLAGSLIATVYNVVFGIWPYAAMNAVIAIIDIYWLLKLRSDRARHYRICPVEPGCGLVADFLDRHGEGIREAYPQFDAAVPGGAQAFLTLFEDEVIGLFIFDVEDGDGVVLIDYVTQRFRDLKPGRTLYADPAIRTRGVGRLVVDPAVMADPAYFVKQGFAEEAGLLVRVMDSRGSDLT